MVSFRSRLARAGIPAATTAFALGLAAAGWLGAVTVPATRAEEAEESAGTVVNRWLGAQSGLTNWSADFVQTRTLKTLTQPLVARGHVWFGTPNRFRWEIGSPAQTVAVRRSNEVLVLYPALKRAERYPVDASAPGPWKHMLTLLEAGFPGSRSELENKFRVVSEARTNGCVELVLEPRIAAARRMMPRFRVSLASDASTVRATEMVFADGSSLRNDFTNHLVNGSFEARIFEPELGPGIRVTEPLGRTAK